MPPACWHATPGHVAHTGCQVQETAPLHQEYPPPATKTRDPGGRENYHANPEGKGPQRSEQQGQRGRTGQPRSREDCNAPTHDRLNNSWSQPCNMDHFRAVGCGECARPYASVAFDVEKGRDCGKRCPCMPFWSWCVLFNAERAVHTTEQLACWDTCPGACR